jgi:hypothetical protein
LENLYAAMVPANGKLILDNADTFNYCLAPGNKAAVHVGWLIGTAFLSKDIVPKIDSLYKSGIKDLLLMGHSQGGAINYLLTAYLYSLQKQNILPGDIRFKTYCSAAPKPGNLFFAYYFESITENGWAFNVVNSADWVPETPNLAVLRTFSKWAGLAGLRLGYGIFPLALMEHLWKCKQPYNVNVAATVAGLASLEDLPLLRERIETLKTERDRLYTALKQIPYLHPLPSQGNFVLCRVEDRPAAELQRQLAAQGILVRYYDKPGLRNYLRISAGRPQDTDRLLAALM